MGYQFSDIKRLGDNFYFPLGVRDISKERKFSPFSRYVFLKSYTEEFSAVWKIPATSFGRLNSDFRYSSTNRKASMSFALPAKNVAEAKQNLDFCTKLAQMTYGNYSESGEEDTVLGDKRYRFDGAKLSTKVKFGNLIRDELCFFSEFSFSPNFESGVFEYGGKDISVFSDMRVGEFQEKAFSLGTGPNALIQEDGFVYHDDYGNVYPKEINVMISMIIVHDYPLGFGGHLRGEKYKLRWAQNKNKDWPHGTGKAYKVPKYIESTAVNLPSSNVHYATAPEGGNDSAKKKERMLLKSLREQLEKSGFVIDENGVPKKRE